LTKKAEPIGLILLLLLSILVSLGYSVSADVNFDNSTVFNVDNENYTFPTGGITFREVAYNETGSWIRFDNTDFNVTSTNPINITVSYLNSNIAGASDGDTVLTFTADTSGGLVWFNLSGFEMFTEYSVFVDDVFSEVVDSTDSDIIHFDHAVWSDHEFDIVLGDQSGSTTRQVKVNYERGSMADVSDTSYSVLGLASLIMLVIVAVIILAVVLRMGNGGI